MGKAAVFLFCVQSSGCRDNMQPYSNYRDPGCLRLRMQLETLDSLIGVQEESLVFDPFVFGIKSSQKEWYEPVPHTKQYLKFSIQLAICQSRKPKSGFTFMLQSQ